MTGILYITERDFRSSRDRKLDAVGEQAETPFRIVVLYLTLEKRTESCNPL